MSTINPGWGWEFATDWTNISAIVAQTEDRDHVRLSIIFTPKSRVRPSPLELGLLERSCFNRIKSRYGAHLKFLESKR
jgi:hypothetical protein